APGRPGRPGAPDIVISMTVRFAGRELRLFSTITTFGTPLDITLDEVAIESYYPADEETAAFFTGDEAAAYFADENAAARLGGEANAGCSSLPTESRA
ncbi:hypothetical protein ACFQ07_21870, partial [Actinomadura adrarensis]